MSDVRKFGNFRPGDDGNLTTADFKKLVNEVFLAAMRPHYEMAAEEWRRTKHNYVEEAKKRPGIGAYKMFRMDWLDEIEQVERARAEISVQQVLAMQAVPFSTAVRRSVVATEAAAKPDQKSEAPMPAGNGPGKARQ